VFLPVAAEKPAVQIPAVAHHGTSQGQERRHSTILVVDDEEMVRRMACMALESQGYEVLEAKDGKEALEILASAASPTSLVLLDLTMPAMGGEELVPILNRDYPGLRIIVTSGYAEAEVRKGFAPGTVAGFLQKPYMPEKLAEKVEEALNSGGPNQGSPAQPK
jgi:CheY-like chemotaxis protein